MNHESAASERADPLTTHLAACRARIDRVAAADVRARLATGAILIDIRSETQRREGGVIRESIWYPRNCLEWRCAPGTQHLDPAVARAAGHVLLLCLQGYQTSLAAAGLRDLGVAHAGEVIDGFEGWLAAGLPVDAYDPAHHALQGSSRQTLRRY